MEQKCPCLVHTPKLENIYISTHFNINEKKYKSYNRGPNMNSPKYRTSQVGFHTWFQEDPPWSSCSLSWTRVSADTRNAPTPSPHPCSPGTCTVHTGPEWRPSSAAAAATRPGGAWQARVVFGAGSDAGWGGHGAQRGDDVHGAVIIKKQWTFLPNHTSVPWTYNTPPHL